VKARAACAVCLLLLNGCRLGSRSPGTHFYVFNRCLGTVRVGCHEIEPTRSRDYLVEHAAVESLAVTDRLGNEYWLVVVSLVTADDPVRYEAAVNLLEGPGSDVIGREYSPWIDARVVAR
jgi:hypothetical protein